jgi:hypothetical protein
MAFVGAALRTGFAWEAAAFFPSGVTTAAREAFVLGGSATTPVSALALGLRFLGSPSAPTCGPAAGTSPQGTIKAIISSPALKSRSLAPRAARPWRGASSRRTALGASLLKWMTARSVPLPMVIPTMRFFPGSFQACTPCP